MSNAAARIPTEGPPVSGREIDVVTLRACRAGEAKAIRAFVGHYQRSVLAFLSRSLGSGMPIEDLAQEVFLRAARTLPDFEVEGPARVSTWLLTIARRLAVDVRRERRLRVQSLSEDMTVADPVTPETERERKEIGRALSAAASQLPDDQRDAFILAEFHGLTMLEIANLLGIPENTARTRLFRAREKLRQMLAWLMEER